MLDGTQAAEATISDESELDTLREGIDDPVVLKAQLAKEAEARRQLTARAKKAEALAKELQTQGKPEVKSDPLQVNSPAPSDEVIDLRLDGYSKEEVAYIMANGGRKALEDKTSFTAIAINTRREQLKAEQAASQTDVSGGEDSLSVANFKLPANPSAADLKKSIADMEKSLPHA